MDQIKKSILHLYPTTKFLVTLFLCISVFIVPGYLYAYSVLFICMFFSYLAGSFKEFSDLAIKALLLIVVFIFILQSFFYPGTHVIWSWSIFSIKQEGIDFALNLTSKIVAIGSSFILFFRITKVKDLISSLEALGLPPKVTYIFLSTLQIIPEMKKLTIVIMDAQKTRGVETEGKLFTRIKAFLPTLSPLILGSIAGTEERVLTLESRAFSAKVKKTSLYTVEKTKYDPIVRIILLILLITLIIWRVML
ncbi:energy-coupling factor transporter transmembrane component T [Shimazuella kribbensis]|uniref:energy-coupling factor transporter transmembrane component T n=1 Tax=Shimazuella kribbensis TaxID=139808 RepID=UPI00041D4C6F|nr:energy-coupling factor transporter transmembrane component T [Shimazuella kribbensis]